MLRKIVVDARLFVGTRVTANVPNDATTRATTVRSVLIRSNGFVDVTPRLGTALRTRNGSVTDIRIISLNKGLIYPPFYSARLRLSCIFATHGPNTIGRSNALFRNVRH